MVSSHIRHFGTLSSAGEGGLKKWKCQLLWKISIYPLTFFQFFLGTGVWNWNLQHQFKSISCDVCIYFSDKFYSCPFPCPNFCPRFLLLYFCPQCFALALFLPSSFALALKMSAKKRAREKSLFCPLIHFPMYFALKFCHCPCPLFLPSCSGQKKRARARANLRAKYMGKWIRGQKRGQNQKLLECRGVSLALNFKALVSLKVERQLSIIVNNHQ